MTFRALFKKKAKAGRGENQKSPLGDLGVIKGKWGDERVAKLPPDA
jgi:hypothetical protein